MFDLQALQFFLSPEGKADIIAEIQRLKQKHAGQWLGHFKAEFPDFCDIVELIAHHTAEDSFLKLKEHLDSKLNNINADDIATMKTFPGLAYIPDSLIKTTARSFLFSFLDGNKPLLIQIHTDLRTEIDRPRY